eukprot:3183401-Rhodomonas_salina.1
MITLRLVVSCVSNAYNQRIGLVDLQYPGTGSARNFTVEVMMSAKVTPRVLTHATLAKNNIPT